MAKKLLRHTPYILPQEYSDMNEFIEKNKLKLTEHVVSSIEFAVNNNLDMVEIFNFDNSGFIVTIEKSSYSENLENIYKYYIETEQYELCRRLKNTQTKLNETEKR